MELSTTTWIITRSCIVKVELCWSAIGACPRPSKTWTFSVIRRRARGASGFTRTRAAVRSLTAPVGQGARPYADQRSSIGMKAQSHRPITLPCRRTRGHAALQWDQPKVSFGGIDATRSTGSSVCLLRQTIFPYTYDMYPAKPGLRWTTGDAAFDVSGTSERHFTLVATGPYWVDPAPSAASRPAPRCYPAGRA